MDNHTADDMTDDLRELTNEPMFPVVIDDVEPLTMFSLEHWLVLYTHGLAPQPPYLMSPFPAQVHTQTELLDNLADWGLLKDGKVDEDLDYILNALASEHTHVVFGHLILPQRTHERSVVYEGVLSATGRPEETTMIEQPTYPFMVVKTYDDRIISALSMEQGLTVNASLAGNRTYAEAFADELVAMIDPESTWSAAEFSSMHVPADAATDPMIVDLTSPDEDTAAKARKKLSDKYTVQEDTLDSLARVNKMDKLALVSITPILKLKDESLYAHPDGSSTWILASRSNEAPKSYVVSPEVDSNTRETYHYAPYTPESLRKAVEEAYKTTAHIIRSRGAEDETNPLHIIRMGVEKAVSSGFTGTPPESPRKQRLGH